MALNFPNPFAGQTTQPAAPPLPRVPWGQNPAITMAGIGLLSGRNLNEGFANMAQTVPAGMVAKSAMQRDMLSQQEKAAEKAAAEARKAQLNEVMKAWPGLSPELRALFSAQPELFGQYAMSSLGPQEAPTVETFYENGLAVKKVWDGSKWVKEGDVKAPEGTSLTVNPDGTVSFQQGDGVMPNGNRGIGRTASGDMEKQIDDLTIQTQQVERIGELYSPEMLTYPGKARNAWAVTADKFGMAGPKDKAVIDKQTRFVQNVEQVFNLYRKDITGAAAALAELDRLKRAVINTDQSPAQFEASLGEFARTLQRGLDIKKKLLNEGIPMGTTQFSQAFEQEFLSQPVQGQPGLPTAGGNAADPLGIR
jgi:hypothetical protein